MSSGANPETNFHPPSDVAGEVDSEVPFEAVVDSGLEPTQPVAPTSAAVVTNVRRFIEAGWSLIRMYTSALRGSSGAGIEATGGRLWTL
jgi:hypothetical protein